MSHQHLLQQSEWFLRKCPLAIAVDWKDHHGYRVCEYWLGTPDRPERYSSILISDEAWCLENGTIADAIGIAKQLDAIAQPEQLSLFDVGLPHH